MKRLFRIIPALFFFGILMVQLAPDARGKKLTIVDYYHKIPSGVLMWQKYQIRNEKGTWKTTTIVDMEIEPTVDIRNGYINIHDEGTGGGSVDHEVVLFLTSAGKPILAVNQQEFTGIGVNGSLIIYDVGGSRWRDVTRQVMPSISYTIFLDENYDKSKLKKMGDVTDSIKIIYSMPRHGTTATASPDFSMFSMTLESDDSVSPALKKMGKELIESVKYKKLTLPWDMKQGRFSLGTKSR